jgi:hypothetical protein
MISLTIDDLHTANQNGYATVFNGGIDALNLVMDITPSADLLALPGPMFQAVFQIVDQTQQVVATTLYNLSPLPSGPFWISAGNNWRPPYATPISWGLDFGTAPGQDVFGFRGIVTAFSNQGMGTLVYLDAFDVLDILWFRVWDYTL